MGYKMVSMVLFLSLVYLCYNQALVSGKVYFLRSAFRQKYQLSDCNLLKVDVNSQGVPSGLSFTATCCSTPKQKHFKVVFSTSSRGLTATFQWLHNTTYYLTARTTGNPLVLERPPSITDSQKFLVKSTRTPGCIDCVSLQSKATNKYLATSTTGVVTTTTNRNLNSVLIRLDVCDKSYIAICKYINIMC
ncbi:uncharacterized protein LOC116292300 [Actinia tenebrosa]|uniref:Uncharacterized protein LOC116292300 n=1 Tax=Actinia tenebrosa TaxID=6105 RepID=A0A6P8HKL7_ACTTE|nr:uncharacterized protein LOC116292300 [Actinia tenebrosa]